MTRTSRTLSAVFMAVVLVLASGAAVSLAVTDSTTDVGTNAADVQETTTTADDDSETASVTINDQESDGEQVVVESATLPEGGFIAIHDSSVAEAPLSSVLGNSVYLEPGTHEDVTITLARPLEESQTIIAMPHFDTNNNEVYDFVLSTGELDGPYTVDGEVLVDQGEVTVAEETTTEEEEVVETTTEEEEVVETTTEQEEVEPAEEQQLIFKIEQMQIEEWSFVVGDEETPDRTETISNVDVQDERVEINLTELLQQQAAQGQMTTVDPEEAQEQLEENLSQDIETVRIVIQNVNVENVTLVITAPEGMELPEPPGMTTTPEEEEEEEVVETTTEEEVVETTTEEEEEVVETTTEEEEEEVVETTTEEEEEVVETTTEEEEEVVETTTEEEEEVVETTTEEEEVVETTTEEEVVETTTEEEEEELNSFEVSGIDAPESATTGDTITVTASVSNPNDQEATQAVAFRLEGTVIDRQSVTLDAGEQTAVTFEINTEGVPAGQYIHGVYTRNFGDLAVIVLEEPTEETTVETETPEGEEMTTTAATTEA